MNLFNKSPREDETETSTPLQSQQFRRRNFLADPSAETNAVPPHFFELSRSMSAPPAEFLTSIQSLIDDNEDEGTSLNNNNTNTSNSTDSFTNDPSYAAYFYSNSRFDPRLPPPNYYSPGQSWQMWPSSNPAANSTVIGGLRKQRINFKEEQSHQPISATVQDIVGGGRKKLVDMIQEDFPRTPSPVHTNLTGDASALHLESVPVVTRTNKKPFSISGSVDAVMAAAIEAENNNDADGDVGINFEFEKMKLLEDDEDESVVGWSKSLRIPTTNKATQPPTIEPFAYAESFVSFVPSNNMNNSLNNLNATTTLNALNSAPARTGGYNSSYMASNPVVYQDENYKIAVMEDFRMNRSKRYELFDLKGMMIDFSTDQHGSRFIQQKLETSSDAEKDAVFNEIYPLALQLMTDVFGNYVIQKFFEHGSRDQRVALAHVMHGHVLTLSLQMYGCRVVQKALEHVPSVEQMLLVQELEGHVLRCVKDQNGNHVIQKCIECVPLKTSAPFLTASFLSQASTLAMHPYGCRVIQRIFEHGPADHSQALLSELLKGTGTLIQDQYGNYVIQHVLEHGHPPERSRIIKFLQGRILEYSRHKFASNVVEKCVSFGTEIERQELIEEVLTPIPADDDNSSGLSNDSGMVIPLHLMMKDQFANYVVQKMLEVVDDGEQRDMLLNCIRPQIHQLKKYTYGKHILSKVERMLGLPPTIDIVNNNSSGYSNSTVNGYNNGYIPHSAHTFNHNNSSNHNNTNTHPHAYAQHHHHSREYHSAPSSPVSKPHDPANHQPRRSGNPKFSKNDLSEFPPLGAGGRRR